MTNIPTYCPYNRIFLTVSLPLFFSFAVAREKFNEIVNVNCDVSVIIENVRRVSAERCVLIVVPAVVVVVAEVI